MIRYYKYTYSASNVLYKEMDMDDKMYQDALKVPQITFITKEDYEAHIIISKADKGQETENAIELNDAIKSYIEKLLREQQFLINGNLKDMIMRPNELEQHHKLYDNNMKLWRAYNNMFNNIQEYERSIAIATNSDASHPIDATNEKDFVNILTHIKQEDQALWLEITKMLNVEITYEPEAVKNEYIKLQQIINSHVTPTIDGHTLASEIPVAGGGTQTK